MKTTILPTQWDDLGEAGRKKLETWCKFQKYEPTLDLPQLLRYFNGVGKLVQMEQYVYHDEKQVAYGFLYWKVRIYNMRTGVLELEADAPELIDSCWIAIRAVVEPERWRQEKN